MKIQELDHGLTLNKPAEDYVRSPGLHMSEIYNSLFEELEPARFSKGDGPDKVKMEVGLAFEETLEIALSTRLLGERPKEFAALPSGKVVKVGTPNSIAFSPDQLLFNGVTRLGEFKATWMSIRHGIHDADEGVLLPAADAVGAALRAVREWRLLVEAALWGRPSPRVGYRVPRARAGRQLGHADEARQEEGDARMMVPGHGNVAVSKLGIVAACVIEEVERAQAKFPPYNSAHEGHSVIQEEFEELWDEIKNNKAEGAALRQMQEAIQVAATAIRYVHDLMSDEAVQNELLRRVSR
jgi:hypothetical protein